MRSFKTEGIVIKRRNFGEADRIITVFTKKSGKLQIKAPGVRRITSKRSSHIELLNYCNLSLYEGKKYPILTEVQSLENFTLIKGNLSKIEKAYYFCELIDGLCPENQENIPVFFLLRDVLRRLPLEQEDVVKEFELGLLNLLGYYKSSVFPDNFNIKAFIEQIMERKLKTKQISLS